MLWDLYCQFRGKIICAIGIFWKNSGGSLINFQWVFLHSVKRMNLLGIRNGKKYYMNSKVLSFESIPTATNSFFLIYSTCLIMKKSSTTVYNLQLSSQSLKLNFKLLKMRKRILIVISMLMSTSKKVWSKTWDFPSYYLSGMWQ